MMQWLLYSLILEIKGYKKELTKYKKVLMCEIILQINLVIQLVCAFRYTAQSGINFHIMHHR